MKQTVSRRPWIDGDYDPGQSEFENDSDGDDDIFLPENIPEVPVRDLVVTPHDTIIRIPGSLLTPINYLARIASTIGRCQRRQTRPDTADGAAPTTTSVQRPESPSACAAERHVE